jgi:hypothetical protein
MVVVDVVLVAADFVVVAADFMLDVAAVAAEAAVAAVAAAAWAFSLAAVALVGAAVVSEAAAHRGASAAFADLRRALLGRRFGLTIPGERKLPPSSNAIHTKPPKRSIPNTEDRHYRLKIKEGVPVAGAAIVGDRVRNTRSALDLLAPCSSHSRWRHSERGHAISDQFMLAIVQHAYDAQA